MKSNYRVVVGRSRSITGPYLDQSGKPMLEGGGTLVIEGDKSNTRRPDIVPSIISLCRRSRKAVISSFVTVIVLIIKVRQNWSSVRFGGIMDGLN